MFEVGSPVSISPEGWVQPAKEGELIYGYVCGPVNNISHKVPISLLLAPDRTVEICYDPKRFPDDSDRFVARHKTTTKKRRKEKK